MDITMAKLEVVAKVLDALPKNEDVNRVMTRREAVQFLRPQIERMLKRGYSMPEICLHLQTQQIDISAGSLKSYFKHSASAPKTRKPKELETRPSNKQDQRPLANAA